MKLYYALLLVSTTASFAQAAFAQNATERTNSISLGIGYNSEDSYKFGEYSGITDQGGFAIGGFSFSSDPEGDRRWSIAGRDIGLDRAGFAAKFEQGGRFQFYLNGDQLPRYRIDDGRSPFRPSGSGYQALPGGWVGASSTAGFSALADSLLPVTLETRRQRLTSGVSWQINKQWQLGSEYRHETKRGEDALGAIFGSTGGNPRGAILARPIDYATDEISVNLAYGGDSSQVSLGYNATLFSNKDKSLLFQNPFDNPQWTSGANFSDGAFGQIALEPDTTSSQFSINGAHRFTDGSRLSASYITTRLQQDDSFLPYSVALPVTTALPRQDLGARVDSVVANLNYSRQLSRRLLLRLRYNYQDRDNKTPVALYLRIAGDSAPQASPLSSNARRNRIYDSQSSRINADLSYRLGGGNRLAFGVEREEKDRTSVDVATTTEDTGFIKFDFKPSATAKSWIKLSRSERDASFYDSTVPFFAGHNPDYLATLVGNEIFENDPLLRRFHLTDRDRDELSAAISIYPSSTIGLSVLARSSRDDYPEALVGLQESERRNLTMDMSYNPDSAWQANLYYSIDSYDNRQAGFARRGGGNPTPFFPPQVRDAGNNWRVETEDNVHTVGAGVDWTLLNGRMVVAFDSSYADAITATRPFSTGQPWAAFPDVSTLIRNMSLEATYKLQENREFTLSWFYENYQSSDWAYTNTDVDTLSNLLLLGDQNPRYAGHMLFLQYVMYLDTR